MSVNVHVMARIAPMYVPRAANRKGFTPTFRWYAAGILGGDASGGVAQCFIDMPTGVQYQGTLWDLEWAQAYIDPTTAGVVYLAIEQRGGEVHNGQPLEHFSLMPLQPTSPYQIPFNVDTHIESPTWKMEGANSYVMLQVNANAAINTYYFRAGGFMYLPIPASHLQEKQS